jgi:prepilin-type N-terminal cleavage/methylation domain-containing protein
MSRTPQIFLVVIVLLLVIVAFPASHLSVLSPQNFLPTFQFLLSNSSTPLPRRCEIPRRSVPRSVNSSLATHRSSLRRGFTLIELMVVIAVVVIMTVLLVPALPSLKGSGDITNAAYTIAGALEQGRAYAMANNTYVWVGFYEEDANSIAPTNASPAYPGRGRLLVAIVASTDGTKIFENADPIASLPATRINQVGKLTKIEGVHLTDIGAPPSPAPIPTPAPNSLAGRPDLPYTEGAPFTHFNRISSDSTDATRFSFSVQNYTFYKTVRFNPRGEANVNSTYAMKHGAEIGLRPTHGSVVDTNSTNVVAVQFSGVSGNFKIYRQ